MTDRSEYFRRYHLANREARLARMRAHYEANREAIAIKRAAYQRRYWHRVGYLKRLNRDVTTQLERFHETRSP